MRRPGNATLVLWVGAIWISALVSKGEAPMRSHTRIDYSDTHPSPFVYAGLRISMAKPVDVAVSDRQKRHLDLLRVWLNLALGPRPMTRDWIYPDRSQHRISDIETRSSATACVAAVGRSVVHQPCHESIAHRFAGSGGNHLDFNFLLGPTTWPATDRWWPSCCWVDRLVL